MAIFTRASLKVLPWMSGHPAQISDTFAGSGACVRLHTHTPTICKLLHAHWIACLASFQTHTGPSVSASLLLYSPPLLSISFFPGAPSRTPGAWGLHFPSPSSLSANARIRFGKGSSFFCVQWTAGTFQIRAEFKVSTKAASMGFLFVSPCLLMSFSIRPKWFVSTSIHTIS